MGEALRLRAMFGDQPVTRALKAGEVTSPTVVLGLADVALAQTAFKRVVRDLEFDVAELAIVTFLLAKAKRVPVSLLPAVVTARFQHPCIVYRRALGGLEPKGLAGLRIGIRSWTVTTVTWLRAMLERDYGADLSGVRWVTFEEPHVAGFPDPPGAVRAGPDKDLLGMLKAGEIDAAVLGEPIEDAAIAMLFRDPGAEAAAWQARHGAIQINHMVVVKDELAERHPEAVREVYRMLAASKQAARIGGGGSADPLPFGVKANLRNLEVAVDYVFGLGFIPRRYGVDELICGAVRDM